MQIQDWLLEGGNSSFKRLIVIYNFNLKEEVTPAAPVDAMSVIETMDTPELPVQRTGRRTRRSLTSMR